MTNPTDALARVAALEGRIEELEAVQELVLRLLSTTRPLAGVLEQYGATETQEQALYRLLDTLTERMRGSDRDRPSFAYFEMRVNEIFPDLRNDRVFMQLVIDTLRVERAAYRALHIYTVEQGWPSWEPKS